MPHKDPLKKLAYMKRYRRLHPERHAEYKARHPERIRRANRVAQLKKYGLTLEDFEAMNARQEGKCAICGTFSEIPLCVDHNHETEEVRSLLCLTCNTGLGAFRDSVSLLAIAQVYLSTWNAK